MKPALLLVALALAGCGIKTTDQAIYDSLKPYVGRPVRVYAEDKMMVPSSWDRPDGKRTFIFKYPYCSVRVTGAAQPGGEYIAEEFLSTCPPGY